MSIIAIGIMQMEPKVKQNHIRGLVLTPTHKLAVQVAEAIAVYGKYLPLRTGVVYALKPITGIGSSSLRSFPAKTWL